MNIYRYKCLRAVNEMVKISSQNVKTYLPPTDNKPDFFN